jgi:nickel-type superoxide dismutase maturation protease
MRETAIDTTPDRPGLPFDVDGASWTDERRAMGRRGWGRVMVDGLSMIPELAPGDHLLVRWGAPFGVGDIVVARRPDRPDLLVVKRAVRHEGEEWWLEGDNAGASDDSRVFGTVHADAVVGRVVARTAPRPVRWFRGGPRTRHRD